MNSDVLDFSQKFQCLSFACLLIVLFMLVHFLLLNLHYLHIALLHFDYNCDLYALLHPFLLLIPHSCMWLYSGEHTQCVSWIMKQ
jgi:hypothetical protein